MNETTATGSIFAHISNLRWRDDLGEGGDCPFCGSLRSFSITKDETWRCATCGRRGDRMKFEAAVAALEGPAQGQIQQDPEPNSSSHDTEEPQVETLPPTEKHNPLSQEHESTIKNPAPKHSEIQAAALEYRAAGFPVIPVNQEKIPTCEQWGGWRFREQTETEVKELFSRPSYGMAILMWPASVAVTLDFDGPHAQKAWEKTGIDLPPTKRNQTRSGGLHHIYRVPDDIPRPDQATIKQELKRKVRLIEDPRCGCTKPCGVDFLVDGYIVVPPTPGYQEDLDHPLRPDQLAVIPQEVLALARQKEKQAAPSAPADQGDTLISDGRRNDTLTSIAGTLRRRGCNEKAITAALLEVNAARCRPPLPESEVQGIAKSVAGYAPAPERSQQREAKERKQPLPEELRGRIIHPALELTDGWSSVGILDERASWRIITAERQVYEAEAIGDALRSKMRSYPDLAGRWPDQDLRGFLSGEGSPGFGEVLALIIDRIRAVLELPKPELYSFLATWIVGTYFHPIFLAYPRLAFMGERETGKTKAETVISTLSFNGLHRLGATPAVLFRIVQAFRPTLCLDEMEGLSKEDRQEIMAIVNSGYKAGGAVDRVEGMGTRWIESYQVYGPMVLAGIRGLNPTTEDRAIPLVFQRGTQTELLNAEVDPADPRLAQIRGGLYRLLLTKARQVRKMYGSLSLPPWLIARVRELWKPLLTIAALGDQEESLGFMDQLLVLAKAHAEEREPLSEEAMALIAILEETLGMASEVEITPGDLCEKTEQALKVKDVSAQRVGAILRRLGFARAERRAGLSRYRITAEKLREACNRYTPPKIA